ncbi:dihydroxyacetone kinase subunit DhaL [Sansalvadorimonas sp. 2012CJ34-2]|uniref:Dihydroxyacetone kinase subunit DhaL n=1 Tax=Parendozoicomonas callyspongiae TaxID=2942213 RepID=A0ABT0PD48_9GAMM|nr:dihydroxyacetone kinase subunit DhaL [Sansalvadorimonas sp. 2012CJ34-2]MCL6269260.1 dihydroxyacetone kinase subunit DhaL [Sansalvadorimonas sp. 2012CJ34-2]
MTQTQLSSQQFSEMLMAASRQVLAHTDELNRLDTETGDGDHGTTMHRAMTALQNTIEKDSGESRKQLADSVGWNIMSQDGGSAGMLVGSFFMGMSESLEGGQTAVQEIALALRAGTNRLLSGSGAGVGDKTMVDALVPAVDAFEMLAEQGADMASAFEAAVTAASNGAENTKGMLPTRGRAKNIGERALGHQDPGATSMSMMFAGFAEYWSA